MSLNIPPVTGMKPSQVAVELRGIIKSLVQQGQPAGGSEYIKAALKHTKRANTEGTNLRAALIQTSQAHMGTTSLVWRIRDAGKRRKPSEITLLADELEMIVNNWIQLISTVRSEAQRATENINYAAAVQAPPGGNLQRAYALVQALPTIDHAPSGAEATALRAMVAILKVHFGVDPEQTIQHALPNLMEDLLEAIKKSKEEPEVVPPVATAPLAIDFEAELMHPAPIWIGAPQKFTIITHVGSELEGHVHGMNNADTDVAQGYGHADDPIGSFGAWQDGDCSLNDAIETFYGVRSKYSDEILTLKWAGAEIARAVKGEPVQFMYGTNDDGEPFDLSGPFTIGSTNGPFTDYVVNKAIPSAHDYSFAGDPKGSNVGWNHGACSFVTAQNVLAAVRCRYSTDVIHLKNAKGEVLALAQKGNPIAWLALPYVSLAVPATEGVGNATQG